MKRNTLISLGVGLAGLAAFGAAAVAMPYGDRHGDGPMMERFDADKDGKITAQEWEAGHAGRFAEMDADGDGDLTAAEMEAYHEKRRAERRERMRQRLDTNQDGKVTADEMAARYKQMFSRLDENGDEVISPDEMPRHRGKMPKPGMMNDE